MIRLEHASRLAMSWTSDGGLAPWREVDGSWVLVDLSGFTRLTEWLAGSGAEGVEVLHDALSRCFEALLGRAIELGGDVLGFAGDAALVHFSEGGHLTQAVEAAASMSRRLAAVPAELTGGRRLRVSIGLHTGPVMALMAGTIQRRLLFVGSQVSLLADLQGAAHPGQVVMSPVVAASLGAHRRGGVVTPGFELRTARSSASSAVALASSHVPQERPDWSSEAVERSLGLLSPAVRELVGADDVVGDHRSVSVGFIMIGGIEAMIARGGPVAAHGVLAKVVDTIARVGEELLVDLLDTDVGVDAVKFLIAAGAPRAVVDDEGRLLLALRRIVDDCGAFVPAEMTVRAGGQRGRVFAGRLGVPGRSTYTVVGDPVNVAARALGAAKPGEVVVGDGLKAGGRASVVATSLGFRRMRNRMQVMELWRVDSVDALQADLPGVSSSLINIARRDEWGVVERSWELARNGAGRSVVLCGEPGMGVSHLVQQAVALAGPAGLLMQPAHIAQHGSYGLVGHLVQTLAASAGDPAGDGGWAWLLAHREGLPDHLRSWSVDAVTVACGGAPATGSDPRTVALRSQRALAALLAAVAPRPWLLAVDDADAADEVSQAVLSELCEQTRDEAILVVLGRRSRETGNAVGLAPSTNIELEAIAADAAEALVLAEAPSLRPDQVVRILAAGRGNPFVLAELARFPTIGELPDSLQRLGSVLIDGLPLATRGLIRDASIFGTSVSLDVISAVLARPDLADPGTWLAAHPVLRPSSDGSVVFVHDAYRAVAYESLTFRRRRQVHSAIADHIQTIGDPAPAALARHLHLAGRLSEAMPLAAEAAMAAKQSGALAEAAELLDRAAEMAQQLGDSLLTRMLLEIAETLSWLGDGGRAEQVFRRLSKRNLTFDERARLSHLFADHLMRSGEYRRAKEWIRRGMAAADSAGTARAHWRCELLIDEAGRHSDQGRKRGALQFATAALEEAERLDDVLLRGKAHLNLEIAHGMRMDEAALAHGDAAVRCFQEAGNDRDLGSAYNNVGLSSMHLGRWAEAFERYERARSHFSRAGRPIDVAVVDLNIGYLLQRQGHQTKADEYAIAGSRVFDVLGARRFLAFGWVLRGAVAEAQGRFHDAEAWMKVARAEFASVGDTALVIDCDVAHLEWLLAVGRGDDVLELAPGIERRLSSAEIWTKVGFDRAAGHARVLAGDLSGLDQVRRALHHARSKRLVYDEYRCLETLLALASMLSPNDLARVSRARDEIVSRLGIVSGAERNDPHPTAGRRDVPPVPTPDS